MSSDPERISFRVFPNERFTEGAVRGMIGQETRLADTPVVITDAVLGEAGAWIELTVENLTGRRIVQTEFAGLRLA